MLRWDDYVFAIDEETWELLESALGGHQSVSFISGLGFDPRATIALERFVKRFPAIKVRLIAIELPGEPREPNVRALLESNRTRFDELVGAHHISRDAVAAPAVAEPTAAGIALLRRLDEAGLIPTDGLLLVDISALPSTIYFPLLAGIVKRADTGRFDGDLVVLATEAAAIDDAIVEEGATDPGYIKGFGTDLTADDDRRLTRVWAPVLGEGEQAQIESILSNLAPEEICPVLPIPAAGLRRCDDILVEYRESLFDGSTVESRNIIYAHESMPFDLYRALCRLSDRYSTHLEGVGRTAVLVSLHSSKLLSIGALLAAIDRPLTVVASGGTEYLLRHDVDHLQALLPDARLAAAWLLGEPYRIADRD